MDDSIFPPGTEVFWMVQAGSTWEKRVGVVVDFLPAEVDAFEVMQRHGETGPLVGLRTTLVDRYLVKTEVAPGVFRFYTPTTTAVRRVRNGKVTVSCSR